MKRTLLSSVIAVLAFTALLGIAYPLVITGVSQIAFGANADGNPNLIAKDTKGDQRYFQPRPSQTEYNAEGTFFSNRGPNSASAEYFYREQPDAYRAMNDGAEPPIGRRDHLRLRRRPAHLRGERRDPGAPRRSRARHPARPRQPTRRENTDGRFLGIFGEPGVNTTKLNEALDR